MKIFPHNFNPNSNSGPNKFTRSLFSSLIQQERISLVDQKNADVEFCLIQQQYHKVKPMVLRLDGIWFNSDQDYVNQNKPIRYSYENSEAVIFQSNFNKTLTEKWFGIHKNSHVIHNAFDENILKSVNSKYWFEKLGNPKEVWSCASNWRPHKRLKENIKYFLEYAPKDAVFAIAGTLGEDDAKNIPNNKRIFLLGDLDYMSLVALYKLSTTFVHLAYLDHCPNVVVDAHAAGCHIICSSAGGTKEIVSNGTIIIENDWDYQPIKLYKPPKLDMSKQTTPNKDNKNLSMVDCSNLYYKVMESLL